jgi:hypothetical protein
MNLHSTILAATTVSLLTSLVTVNVARADDAPATTEPTTTTTDGAVVTEDGAPVPPAEEAPGAEFGIGIRLRNVRLPQGIFELFVETAAGASSQLGLGVDLVRRRENFELHIGLEYEKIGAPAGIWIEKDKPIPANEADFVEFNNFGWVSIEANFISHHNFTEQFALRYGGGAGIGILFGNVTHVDRICTSSDKASCNVDANGGVKVKYDLKSPVYPVITGLIGVQYRPTKKVTVNLETGIRTALPFFGISGAYFF